jgi:hypothetical protein
MRTIFSVLFIGVGLLAVYSVYAMNSDQRSMQVAGEQGAVVRSISPEATENSIAVQLFMPMLTALLCFGAAFVLIRDRQLFVHPRKTSRHKKTRRTAIASFLLVGVASMGVTVVQLAAMV